MLYMMVATHSPESCPASNPKYRAQTLAWFENIEAIQNKHGIKTLGFWTDHPAHTIYSVYDAPSMEANMALMMEPLMAAMFEFQSMRIFPVMTDKETYMIIKQGK